ncbi:glucuronyl esterase domain-containing protein [Roseimaritima sediminicola]|uniref:glucuronyl esterase domain-containing protein n=1 Tax=Roseimaritima sediminicola TaxID=2662066 RepID=UPI001F2CFEBB|nr:acetylxylan esterase [Roseimaritima sediminicola]
MRPIELSDFDFAVGFDVAVADRDDRTIATSADLLADALRAGKVGDMKTSTSTLGPLVLSLLFICPASGQQRAAPNHDETLVPEFRLPDPLAGVSSPEQWPARRQKILEQFAAEMYGKVPAEVTDDYVVKDQGTPQTVLAGKATMRQPVITVAGRDLSLLVLLPAGVQDPVPVFLAYNFHGNHTVLDHPDIALTDHWVRKGDHRAKEEQRGQSTSSYGAEQIIDAGFGLVTLYYGDVDPDVDDDFQNGVHAAFENPPADDQWGSIATWAWGLSRVLDYLETVPGIDAERVAVMGHSRLGKTALWAGARDQRFSIVISNNSGCGGAALSRRRFGETVERINTVFPHWFCDNFLKYNDNEDALPFDQHMLIALMAPRPTYVASAARDLHADPRGEFLATLHASPVYELLGTSGLPADEMPPVDEPVHGQLGYHVRSGGHAVTAFDWQQYIAFARKHWQPED